MKCQLEFIAYSKSLNVAFYSCLTHGGTVYKDYLNNRFVNTTHKEEVGEVVGGRNGNGKS